MDVTPSSNQARGYLRSGVLIEPFKSEHDIVYCSRKGFLINHQEFPIYHRGPGDNMHAFETSL